MKYNNEAFIVGIVSSIEEEYESTDKNRVETYYKVMVEIPRFSENYDLVPFIMSSKMIRMNGIEEGMKVQILGSIRTRNIKDENGRHKKVYGFASEVHRLSAEEYDSIEEKNRINIEGVVCTEPIFRRTNSGRLITDLVIAQSRGRRSGRDNKKGIRSYYLPCLAWGDDAKTAKDLQVGDVVRLVGRFQSRKYRRKADLLDNIHVAYEISILDYVLLDNGEEIRAVVI